MSHPLIPQLAAIFPDASADDIVHALEASSGDPDRAAAQLLQTQHGEQKQLTHRVATGSKRNTLTAATPERRGTPKKQKVAKGSPQPSITAFFGPKSASGSVASAAGR